MKKVLLVAVIAMAAVACKKSYACKVMGIESAAVEYSNADAKEAKKTCEAAGGTWITK